MSILTAYDQLVERPFVSIQHHTPNATSPDLTHSGCPTLCNKNYSFLILYAYVHPKIFVVNVCFENTVGSSEHYHQVIGDQQCCYIVTTRLFT